MSRIKSATEWLDNQKTNRFHILVIVLSFFILVFDGFDSQIMAYIMPQLIKEWNLTPVVAGSMASYGFVGLMIGTAVFGMISDKIGRKKAIMIAIADFTIFSGAAYFAPNFNVFVTLRLFAGLGMGGAMPITIALVSEYAPAKIRGKAVTGMFSGFTMGWIVAALAGMLIIPNYGWRPVLLIGALPIVLIPIFYKFLPESIRFLAGKGRYDEAIGEIRKIEQANGLKPAVWGKENFGVIENQVKGHIKDLFTAKFATMTILISMTYFFNLLVVYGLSSWLPTLLVKQGFSLVKSYSYGMVQAIAASIGAFVLGTMLDRFGRKKTLIVAYILGAISMVFFGYATTSAGMIIAGALTGFFVIGSQTAQHVITGEVFPTQIRSTGVGFVYSVGRIGSFVAPLLGGALMMADISFSSYFLIFAIAPLICAGAVSMYKINAKGEGLEQITYKLTENDSNFGIQENPSLTKV